MTPTPTGTIADTAQVTPGWVGFAVTAVFVVVVIVLIFDMVRRMRRVRYREEAQLAIAEELERDKEGAAKEAAREDERAERD